MRLELHVLQSFPASSLNRDDTGNDKSVVFGGYDRTRISSQCLKKAMRDYFRENSDFTSGLRTKVLLIKLDEILKERGKDSNDNIKIGLFNIIKDCYEKKKDEDKKKKKKKEKEKEKEKEERNDEQKEEIELVKEEVKEEVKKEVKEEEIEENKEVVEDEKFETDALIFVGENEIELILKKVLDNWDVCKEDDGVKKKSIWTSISKELKKEWPNFKTNSLDIALFGRMLASKPELNIEAASQVAHAFSTHETNMEFDFFTAADDVNSGKGAAMMGVSSFGTAVFYKHYNLNLRHLSNNFCGDKAILTKAVKSFIDAVVYSVPSGKQNSFAANTRPSLLCAVLRNTPALNLANAFLKPVTKGHNSSLLDESKEAISNHWNDLGVSGLRGEIVKVLVTDVGNKKYFGVDSVPFDKLVEEILDSIKFD